MRDCVNIRGGKELREKNLLNDTFKQDGSWLSCRLFMFCPCTW